MAQHYSIFLSYRHKPRDAAMTQRAFNLLEAYRLPAGMKRKGCQAVTRVFRDTEELPVSRVLSNTIELALNNSDYLVVICSPDTPESEWVDREVATFIELGKAERIFPLLIQGTPETSFPPSLRKIPDIAERVMDVRAARRPSARAPGPLLRVIAAVAGCSYETLARAEDMRQRRKSAARTLGSIAIAAAVTAVVAVLWLRAESYREASLREQKRSMEILSHLTYDLPNKLVELPSTYAVVAEMLDENAQQIDRILNLARESDGIREQIAANYEKHATASTRLGAYETAYKSQKSAIEIYLELAGENAEEGVPELASAYNNLGVLCNAAGSYQQAADAYEESAALLEPLWADARTSTPELAAELAAVLSNSGVNAMDLGDFAAAKQLLSRSVELYESLREDGSANARLNNAIFNLGVCFMSVGDYAPAEAYLTRAAEAYAAQYAALQNRTNLKPYANTLAQLALCLASEGKFDAAAERFPEAIALLEQLAEGQDDSAAQSVLATACNNYGYCLNLSGQYAAAEPWYLRYAEIQEALYAKSGTALSRASMARAYYNVAENAFKAGNYEVTRLYFKRSLDEYAPVYEELGSYHEAEYFARLAYYRIIVKHEYPAALEAADHACALQPDSSFAQINRVYALLFNRQYEACDACARAVGARSEGERVGMALDIAAFKAAGMQEPHMDALLALLDTL